MLLHKISACIICYLTLISNEPKLLIAFEARMSMIKVLSEAIFNKGSCLFLKQHLCAFILQRDQRLHMYMVKGTKEADLYHCHFVRKLSTFKDGILMN